MKKKVTKVVTNIWADAPTSDPLNGMLSMWCPDWVEANASTYLEMTYGSHITERRQLCLFVATRYCM